MVWTKEAASKDKKESTGRKHEWIHSGYRLGFSPVQRITYKWNVEPLGNISNHLSECPFNKPFEYDDSRINLRDMHGADVEFIYDGIRPSDLLAAKFQASNDS
ncbi:hypothetical protein AAVH_04234 [Aphelenchoides avenae]|nr:hypothetical protein AAVH_04234 [Aphelenchus avenae]